MADIRAKSFNFGGSDRYIIPQDFIINVTVGSEGLAYTADKTYAEILEAYNMGHTLYVDYSLVRLTLMNVSDERFVFIRNTGEMIVMASISESDIGVVVEYFEPVPSASTPDAGKVLMVGDSGNAVWAEPPKSGAAVQILTWEATD